MSIFNRLFVVALVACFSSCCIYAGGIAEDPDLLKGSASVDLNAATIKSVSPLNVLPGTLVGVEGNGFGTKPGIVKLGGTVIDSFIYWTNTVIFFRVPQAGLKEGAKVQVGVSYSEDQLRPAPEGSITIRWNVNIAKLDDVVAAQWKTCNAPVKPVFKAPLHVKGEWVKSSELFGNSAVGDWDGGSRRAMALDKSGKIWYAEVVLTPENIATFGINLMKFAFEDGDNDSRTLSPFESDYTFILKRDWAKTDSYAVVVSDPAVTPGKKDKLFDEKTSTINLVYPVKE